MGDSGVRSGSRGEPPGAVTSYGSALSEVPIMSGNSQAEDEAVPIMDMLSHAPVEQSSQRSEIFLPSQSNPKNDASVQFATPKKFAVVNHFTKYSLPAGKTILKIGAQDAARTQRSGG